MVKMSVEFGFCEKHKCMIYDDCPKCERERKGVKDVVM